jgi:hypothetical protein
MEKAMEYYSKLKDSKGKMYESTFEELIFGFLKVDNKAKVEQIFKELSDEQISLLCYKEWNQIYFLPLDRSKNSTDEMKAWLKKYKQKRDVVMLWLCYVMLFLYFTVLNVVINKMWLQVDRGGA